MLHGFMPWESIPNHASDVYIKEIASGRGPVFMKQCESAIIARLRMYDNYEELTGASEGLGFRLARYARSEPTIEKILERTKTKRYVMSRLRRMKLCAALNITADDVKNPPPYIRVLAMNKNGMKLLNKMRKTSKLPIITKPASVLKFNDDVIKMFNKEAECTDLYTLAYPNENERIGGGEWLESPRVIKK